MTEYRVSSEIEHIFKNMPETELSQKLEILHLPQDREEILKEILTGKKGLDISDEIDIKIYALKELFPDSHDSLKLKETIFSKSELCHYDPAKNGQNIIKHGVSFREVISYSTQFGTLMVPCPETNNERRIVIFSDLTIDNERYRLSLPLEGSKMRTKFHTLTVAQQIPAGFRFISSRLISRRKFSKTMKNAFKNIYPDNPEHKQEFINHCIGILRRDLFEKVTASNANDFQKA
ncbi:hypothetical protein [Stutzerimonas nitrititolerans]|uniref:hypothetical protein n=1 Tax=Stutzerimonas nitrititolerans TaxID=2482751 RepID=UPI00264902A9|nr:hypothetical protein [Stutzerimonas nitrititolerans]